MFARITQIESSGTLTENSVEFKADVKFSDDISFDTNYNLGKIVKDFEEIFSLPVDNYNTRLEKSESNLDHRHCLSSSLKIRLWKLINFSSIFPLESAKPYTLTTGLDNNNDSVVNDSPLGIKRNSLRRDWFKQFNINIS